MKPKMIAGKPAHIYWRELRQKSKRPKKTAIKRKPYQKNVVPGLTDWYMNKMQFYFGMPCEECGQPVLRSVQASQAHLLPKEKFKSIALHLLNHALLGAECGCHTKYDKSWASARKMKIWPTVQMVIVQVLIPLLPKEEFKKLPDFLKELYYASNPKRVQENTHENRPKGE